MNKECFSYSIGIHLTVEKRANRMPDITVETTLSFRGSGVVLKILNFQYFKFGLLLNNELLFCFLGKTNLDHMPPSGFRDEIQTKKNFYI